MASSDAFKVSLLLLFFVFLSTFNPRFISLECFMSGTASTPDERGVFLMCVSGVFTEGESYPDNRCQLGHRRRYERPLRQTRSSAGSERPRRRKPEESSSTVQRVWSCWGTSCARRHDDVYYFCKWLITIRWPAWVCADTTQWILCCCAALACSWRPDWWGNCKEDSGANHRSLWPTRCAG